MTNLTLNELFRALWRRRIWFLVPLLLGVAAGVAALKVLPPTYRAETKVLVEPQRVPTDYVKPTVTVSMQDRLRTIEPLIKNRDNLERIVREIGLYPELRGTVPMDLLGERASRDLLVEPRGDTFHISFKNSDPVKAARTANRVADLFIQSNLDIRENQAQGTSKFLESELAATKRRLEQQEARIAAFKSVHMGNLPEQRDTNLRSVEQLQTKLEINMDAMDKAETRRLLLQTQLAELRREAEQRRAAPARSILTESAPGQPSRLELLRAELIQLRARYTDRHPDVIRTQAEVEQLEKLESARPSRPATVEVTEAEPEPVRIDPTLKAELASVDMELRSLRAERGRILADISQTQGRLENVPRVEQDLLSLTRDYDNIRNSYESLLDKRLNARLYENLEKSQQGERFTIIERAVPPRLPYEPKPLLVIGLGLVAGGALGLLAALLRDRTDPTYSDIQSFQDAFPGVPVLATIPVFKAARETSGSRRS
ncbi:MAG TPA: Wzz/FepE/Etk N-terminal domain-containing protein [Thermoanaerobaculia bacterium]|nr:Wzz/FepE/Etk N-terminal domain-containing protein [Thermoanaerobaculia bacterium]